MASYAEPLHSNRYTSTLDVVSSARNMIEKPKKLRFEAKNPESKLPEINTQNKATFVDP